MGRCGGPEELTITVSTLGGCAGLERTDFKQFLLWKGVVVLKELTITVSTLGGCAGLERTDFKQFLLWLCVAVSKK